MKSRNSNPTGRTDGPRKGAKNSSFYTTPGDATKIDVEGHELSALSGMRRLLERDHPTLIVEGRTAEVTGFLTALDYDFEDHAGSPNRVYRSLPAIRRP